MQNRVFVLLIAGCAVLASCDSSKSPTGQVVARINGDEVTVAELNGEATAQGVPGASSPEVRRQLLQAIIDRKLIAQSATKEKLDRSPEFLLMRKRAEELMLADLFIRKVLSQTNAQPGADAVEAFARSQPTMFDERTVFAVDQIRFARSENPALNKQLAGAKTLADIEAALAAAGVQRERGTTQWDSARMPPELVRQIKALPAGEPFIQTGNPMVAGVIVSARPVPVPPQARAALAAQGLQQQRVRESARAWLEGSRRKAKIQYQTGYAPAAPAGAAPSGTR
jgi:EpsD family peptidyl-prolyl cis-trans isomerase